MKNRIKRSVILDRDLIMAHILSKPREYILAHPELTLNKRQQKTFDKYSQRRSQGEPLAYIVGHKEFYGYDFSVDKRVLIPRPETEQLLEQALECLSNRKGKILAVDVGTGSGCIIISLAKQLLQQKKVVDITLWGVDISSAALAVAKKNSELHQVENIISFYKSDLISEALIKKQRQQNAKQILILANLPYLSMGLYSSTSASVKNFEPKTALLSGQDGLAHYRRLFSQIKKIRSTQSGLKITTIIEISPEQKRLVEKLIDKQLPGLRHEFYRDLAGKWRICQISF